MSIVKLEVVVQYDAAHTDVGSVYNEVVMALAEMGDVEARVRVTRGDER